MENRINELLNKYWEAETSPEEEKELRDYFAKGNVSTEHEPFMPLFGFFHQQQNIAYTLPDLGKIRALAVEQQKVRTLSATRKFIYAIAAVLSLVLASWFIFQNIQKQPPTMAHVTEIEDPEEAYRVTMAALAMVSGKLNKGTESIEIGLENVNKANIFK